MASRFYTEDGRAIQEVPTADGKSTRPVRVSDAIKNNWRPSWTTMIKETLAAPGLERWKLKTILEAALTLPEIPGESLEDRAERAYQDADAHPKKARDEGSIRHDMFMNILKGKKIPPKQQEFANRFKDFLKVNQARTIQTEKPLVGKLSAGRPDWITYLTIFGNPEQGYVVDYKGQEIMDKDGVPRLKNGRPVQPSYSPEMWIQCGGYSLDWHEKHSQKLGACVIVFCRNSGLLYPQFKSVNEMKRWRDAARLVRALWRNLHGLSIELKWEAA